MKNTLLALLLSLTVAGSLHAADEAEVVEHVKEYTDAWRASYAKDESNFTIQEVVGLLNLNHKGLEQLKVLVEQENWEAAQTELFTYFKKKYKDVPVVEPMTPDEIKIAEDALGHVIKGNKNYPPAFRGVELDWTSLAVIDGKTVNSKEWLYQFHRKGWWKPLSYMYTLHQDERYFNEWLYEMITYYRAFPDLSTAPKYASRGMETFGRTASYLDSIPHMIHSDQFTEEVLLLYLGTFHKSTEHIRTVYSGKGNHLVSELTQVLINAVELPEFEKAAEWEAEAMRRLPEQMELCIFEDGMNREFVFSYHTFYIELFSKFYEIVQQYNLESELPESYVPILQNMHTVYGEFILPDFTVPQFGDAWKYRKIVDGVPESRYGYLIETYSERYPENEVLAYFAKKFAGEAATPPTVKNAYYPQSGFYSLRSGWNEDSVIMAIKNTEGEKVWHNQPDNGTFLLYANGRNFMSDSGCFIYDSPVPEEQEWRQYFKATRNHQTLTLDNENVRSRPSPPEMKEADRYTRLKIGNQSYDNLRHDRTIWFVDNTFYVILDEAAGTAQGNVRAHFQLNPAPVSIQPGSLTAATTYEDGNNLSVRSHPIGGVKPKMKTDEGWIAYHISHKEPRTAWHYSLNKRGPKKSVQFLTSIVPTKNIDPSTIDVKMDTNGAVFVKMGEEILELRRD